MTGQVRLRQQAEPRDSPTSRKLVPVRLSNGTQSQIRNDLSEQITQARQVTQ